jgi:hypothetical protein
VSLALDLTIRKAPPVHQLELQGLKDRIDLCNSRRNQFSLANIPSRRDDKPYTIHSRFFRCNSKLCPDCLARQSAKTRRRLRDAVARQTLRRGERYYFVTFTIVNPSRDLLFTRSIVARAWTLFRKRQLCVSLFRGGSKSEEFTVTKNGFHYHLHCLFLSKFMLYNELRRTWTDCVAQAFADHELELVINRRDNMLSVDIQLVIPNSGLYFELCKYLTKSHSWLKMPLTDLRDIALVRRWHRMFELFGSFADRCKDKEPPRRKPNVHTRFLTDGTSSAVATYWRDKVNTTGNYNYYLQIIREFESTRRMRIEQLTLEHPDATLIEYL